MKRKPSKSTEHVRRIKALKQSPYITLTHFGTDSLFFTGTSSYTLTIGDLITSSSFDTSWGNKVFFGKNPKKVHPARRRKEAKKVRIEAYLSMGNEKCTVVKESETSWYITGIGIV